MASRGYKRKLVAILHADVQGPVVWKDSYVYCFEDQTGKILAHKNPAIIDFEAKDLRDV